MLDVSGRGITFYFFFTEDGVGDTGLTVTCNIRKKESDGTKTTLVTDGACTEWFGGAYYYTLASGSVSTEGDYLAIGHTADTDTDQQDVPAMWAINKANLEDIDDILTDTGTTLPNAISGLNDITADNVLDATVEGTYSLKEVLRIMSGVLAGKLSGGGTTTLTFRDISDSLNRVVATVDASGNRSAITINEA